jgi:diguanylate cyclase (GGDEF)-like protein
VRKRTANNGRLAAQAGLRPVAACLAIGLSGASPARAAVAQGAAEPLMFLSGFVLTTLFLLAYYAVRLHRQSARLSDANAQMTRQMLTDPLTGVENRIHLEKRLAQEFAEGRGGRIGVCHVELEQFKSVIRTLGHKAGDEALRTVADLLRDVFGAEGFIARVGGDEFIVILPNPSGVAELERLASEVVDHLNSPIWIGAHQRRIGGVVGIALGDESVTSPERLLMNADLALFDARKAGGGNYRMFAASVRNAFESREQVLNEIHVGLREGAFIPYFQPQIDASTGEHLGFEALARWRHPERGVLTPAHFLEIAVESGLIEQIGASILRKSLQAMARWRQMGFDAPQLGLNFSAVELRDPNFLDKLQWDLELVDIGPGQISIEILESVLIDDDEDPAARNVAALAAAGYRIDLDDFGTGHASISNLKKIKVDRLKIDRSFVAGIDSDPGQRKLADSILYIANTLDLDVIAEGVETEGEMRTLIEMGCVSQQGYLHGRPMSEEDCMTWMAESTVRQRSIALSSGAQPRRSA